MQADESERVHRGYRHVDRPRRAAIRSRDVTAHFNEIDRAASRFFVKIPAPARSVRRSGRVGELSWTRSRPRAAAFLSAAKGCRGTHASRLKPRV
jgi:hypothetical protein